MDALAFAEARQRELILKPVALHGGLGIVPGWAVDKDEWRRRVTDSFGGQYILQERVRPLPDQVLLADEITGLHCNWGVFLFDPGTVGGSGFGGCIVRGTADPDTGIISMGNGAVVGACLIG